MHRHSPRRAEDVPHVESETENEEEHAEHQCRTGIGGSSCGPMQRCGQEQGNSLRLRRRCREEEGALRHQLGEFARKVLLRSGNDKHQPTGDEGCPTGEAENGVHIYVYNTINYIIYQLLRTLETPALLRFSRGKRDRTLRAPFAAPSSNG